MGCKWCLGPGGRGEAMKTLALLLLVGCSTQTGQNTCVIPTDVVPCEVSNFYWFRVESEQETMMDKHPIWQGSQCQITPCQTGDMCEVYNGGAFVTGVCQ